MSNETCPLEHVVLLFSFPKVFLGKGDPLVEGLQRQFPPAPRDRPFGVTSVGGDPGMSGMDAKCPEAGGLGKGSCVVEPAWLWVQPCTRQPYPDLK